MQNKADEVLYTKGFNNGYILAQHYPELASQLSASPSQDNIFIQGLKDGKEQQEIEMLHTRLALFDSPQPTSSKNPDKDIERDK